jgi:arginine decarboxylase
VLGARPTESPIVRVLNRDVGRYHRWCTPSILEDQERVEDFYASDISISAGFFGTLVDHTGVFGEAERFAAAAQGADRTMFSVHGSSGSNWIVLRALALERQDALVLVARNTHHSVINALKAFGLDFRFLPAPYEPRFEAVLPPSVEQIAEGMRRSPDALAVLYTSPTYEGLTADTRGIVDAVHSVSDAAMVIVDEAWGGHLHFHPALPDSAMASGADVCVQSTHKLAGGLQQTGLLHWREGRVDSELMEEAYREYVTTSPSYHLLASADAAVRTLAAQGEEALGRAIERTDALKAGLRAALPDPRLDGRRRVARVGARARARLRPHQDDGRPEPVRAVGLRRRTRARLARRRDREGRRTHDHADHDVPARRRGGAGHGRRAARRARGAPAPRRRA